MNRTETQIKFFLSLHGINNSDCAVSVQDIMAIHTVTYPNPDNLQSHILLRGHHTLMVKEKVKDILKSLRG